MYEEETQVAWQAMPEHAPVMAADGSEIGITEKLLGDLEDDIFHGIVIKRDDGKAVEIPARRIRLMTTRHVVTDLQVSDAEKLEPYSER